MIAPFPALRLTGARVLRDGTLQERSVAFEEGRLTTGPLPEIDLGGYLVLPGIVDLHAEGLGALNPAAAPEAMLAALDRLAAGQGLTTCYWSQPVAWESPEADLARATDLAAALGRYRPGGAIDLRMQLRCESGLIDYCEALLRLIRGSGIDLVMFSDGAAELGNLRTTAPLEFELWCRKRGRQSARLATLLDALLSRRQQIPRHLCRMAETFDAAGVIYGSIGDRRAESREYLSMIGARLCLCPRTARTAAAARAVGDPVIVPADDLIKGVDRRDDARSLDLVEAGLCSALVSGRNPAAMAMAPFRLADLGLMPLEKAWRLVSEIPAELLRLPDRGVIEPGKRADLVVINAETRQVEATIAGGRIAYLTGEAVNRFLGARGRRAIAAE